MQCEKCLSDNPSGAEVCAQCGTRLPGQASANAIVMSGFSGRWLAATGVGLVCALPIGWLLATAALLPFYLGVFFFALFGLMLGAVLYRIGSPGAPIAKGAVYTGGLLVIALAWLIAMGFEYRHLYPDAVRHMKESQRSLTPEQLKQIDRDTPGLVRKGLGTPGGLIGYMHWAATSGKMKIGVTPHGAPVQFLLRQRPIGWVSRVIVCTALLVFGVFSQIAALSKPPTAPEKNEAPSPS